MDVAARILEAPGFVATLSPEVVSTDGPAALLRLDAGGHLHNHLGGPHAAAIFGLGETAAFAVLLSVFGDLVEAGAVPLVGAAEIAYTDVATGPLLAEAALAGDEAGTRTHFGRRGRASFSVEVVFRRESDRVQTARATYRMAVRRSD